MIFVRFFPFLPTIYCLDLPQTRNKLTCRYPPILHILESSLLARLPRPNLPRKTLAEECTSHVGDFEQPVAVKNVIIR